MNNIFGDTKMAEIDEYRKEIEIIDKEMAEMFERRMKCSYNIAAYKRIEN